MNLRLSPGLLIAAALASGIAAARADDIRACEFKLKSGCIAGDAKVFLPALKAKAPNVEVIPVDQLDLDSPTLRKAGK